MEEQALHHLENSIEDQRSKQQLDQSERPYFARNVHLVVAIVGKGWSAEWAGLARGELVKEGDRGEG